MNIKELVDLRKRELSMLTSGMAIAASEETWLIITELERLWRIEELVNSIVTRPIDKSELSSTAIGFKLVKALEAAKG